MQEKRTKVYFELVFLIDQNNSTLEEILWLTIINNSTLLTCDKYSINKRHQYHQNSTSHSNPNGIISSSGTSGTPGPTKPYIVGAELAILILG